MTASVALKAFNSAIWILEPYKSSSLYSQCTLSVRWSFFEEVKDLYVPEVSDYSDEVQNGFETLAEAYVKIKNGEDVLEKAKEYVEDDAIE